MVIASAGMLGSLIKVESGGRWVVATLRGITWQGWAPIRVPAA